MSDTTTLCLKCDPLICHNHHTVHIPGCWPCVLNGGLHQGFRCLCERVTAVSDTTRLRYEARQGLHYNKPRWSGYIDGKQIKFAGLMIGDAVPCIHRFRWAALFHAWWTIRTNKGSEWEITDE